LERKELIRKRNIGRGAIFSISSLAKQNLIKIVPAEKSMGCKEEKSAEFCGFFRGAAGVG